MPNWQPNWNNVVWDYGAASAAAHELRRAADLLEESIHKKQSVAKDAAAEWQGRYRDQFDVDLGDMLHQARDLAGRCRRKASEIEDASERARIEQDRREEERRRWRWEKLQEEIRRAQGNT